MGNDHVKFRERFAYETNFLKSSGVDIDWHSEMLNQIVNFEHALAEIRREVHDIPYKFTDPSDVFMMIEIFDFTAGLFRV